MIGGKVVGYRVVQITMDHVTIDHSGENGVAYSTDIPIDSEKLCHKSKPLTPRPCQLWPIKGTKMRVTIAQRSGSGWRKAGHVFTTEAIEGAIALLI